MKKIIVLLILLSACAVIHKKSSLTELKVDSGATSQLDIKPEIKITGVTLDSIQNTGEIVEALRHFKVKPTVRIVFDENMDPSYYKEAVSKIHKVSYVMGSLVDSFYVKNYSVKAYHKRAEDFLNSMSDDVDIWEIGNEINGEWLGETAEVIEKLEGAYKVVKKHGKTTALTLYYNDQCWEKPDAEMFKWVQKNISQEMKQGLDFVFVSYYEDDCENLQPKWGAVFQRLGVVFPNSKIGFGEVGSKFPEKKAEYIKRYYQLKVIHPQYVGGYFWWYFHQDMVPMSKPLWNVLNSSL